MKIQWTHWEWNKGLDKGFGSGSVGWLFKCCVGVACLPGSSIHNHWIKIYVYEHTEPHELKRNCRQKYSKGLLKAIRWIADRYRSEENWELSLIVLCDFTLFNEHDSIGFGVAIWTLLVSNDAILPTNADYMNPAQCADHLL